MKAMNSTRVHCSQEKSMLTAKKKKKKKKKDAFTACNYSMGPMPKTQPLKRSKR